MAASLAPLNVASAAPNGDDAVASTPVSDAEVVPESPAASSPRKAAGSDGDDPMSGDESESSSDSDRDDDEGDEGDDGVGTTESDENDNGGGDDDESKKESSDDDKVIVPADEDDNGGGDDDESKKSSDDDKVIVPAEEDSTASKSGELSGDDDDEGDDVSIEVGDGRFIACCMEAVRLTGPDADGFEFNADLQRMHGAKLLHYGKVHPGIDFIPTVKQIHDSGLFTVLRKLKPDVVGIIAEYAMDLTSILGVSGCNETNTQEFTASAARGLIAIQGKVGRNALAASTAGHGSNTNIGNRVLIRVLREQHKFMDNGAAKQAVVNEAGEYVASSDQDLEDAKRAAAEYAAGAQPPVILKMVYNDVMSAAGKALASIRAGPEVDQTWFEADSPELAPIVMWRQRFSSVAKQTFAKEAQRSASKEDDINRMFDCKDPDESCATEGKWVLPGHFPVNDLCCECVEDTKLAELRAAVLTSITDGDKLAAIHSLKAECRSVHKNRIMRAEARSAFRSAVEAEKKRVEKQQREAVANEKKAKKLAEEAEKRKQREEDSKPDPHADALFEAKVAPTEESLKNKKNAAVGVCSRHGRRLGRLVTKDFRCVNCDELGKPTTWLCGHGEVAPLGEAKCKVCSVRLFEAAKFSTRVHFNVPALTPSLVAELQASALAMFSDDHPIVGLALPKKPKAKAKAKSAPDSATSASASGSHPTVEVKTSHGKDGVRVRVNVAGSKRKETKAPLVEHVAERPSKKLKILEANLDTIVKAIQQTQAILGNLVKVLQPAASCSE